MPSNCERLLSGEFGNKIESGTNRTVIWLTSEDISSIFNLQVSSLWLPGFIMIISWIVLTPFICFKLYNDKDKEKRIEKMKEMGITATKPDITPILDPYCEYNRDIIEIIFKFTGIKIENYNDLMTYSYQII